MSVMGRFAKLDSSLQRGLDNGFAFVFGGKVVPAEIEELLKQEAEDNVVHTYEGFVEVPNEFRVAVSPKDFKNLSSQAPTLPGDFADRLSRFFRNQRWVAAGPVVVEIFSEQGLRTGQLKAESRADAGTQLVSGFEGVDAPQAGHQESRHEQRQAPQRRQETRRRNPQPHYPQQPQAAPYTAAPRIDVPLAAPAAPAAAPDRQSSYEYPETVVVAAGSMYGTPEKNPVVSLLLQDGSSRSYMVQEGSNIIGRSNEADFRLPDTGVSRKHAEITWDGRDAILVDLQSTNGTAVNDMPIENWLLADGDVIAIGHSYIEVRIVED